MAVQPSVVPGWIKQGRAVSSTCTESRRASLYLLSNMSLSLLTALGLDSRVKATIISYVHSDINGNDLISLASVSTPFLESVKSFVATAAQDISLGASPIPIPYDFPKTGAPLTVRSSANHTNDPSIFNIGGPLPISFRYLKEVTYPQGMPDSSWLDVLQGCECSEQCGVCGSDSGGEGAVIGGSESSCCSCVRLNAAVQSGSTPLFECHAGCSCTAACSLRTTQQGGGRKPPPIRLRHLGRKGWGAYSTDSVEAGVFVADYTGEVLPVDEARRRVAAYDQVGINYVLTTQEFFQGGKQVWQTIVDATTSGNVSRFFNHSCEPTLSVFVVRRGSFAPRLAFFTRERVPAGSELTYDYGAADSAGGGKASRDRGDEDQALHQPVHKTPRSNTKQRGTADSFATNAMSVVAANDSPTLEPLESGEKETAGDSSDENVPLQGDAAPGASCPGGRRRCLCGARRCRGLLPCNRAIL